MDDGPLALSWSGGKDSALALWELRRSGRDPVALLTTMDESVDAVAHHGVARSLLERQARSVGVPLVTVDIPRGAPNTVYEERLADAFAAPPLDRLAGVAFGDLFLEDLRAYREERLRAAGLRAVFPLWARDTDRLARTFIASGFGATVVSVDRRALDPSFLGREFDVGLLDELPEGVDPCGENGELHTFVHRGPIFSSPIAFEPWGVTATEEHAWLELRTRPGRPGRRATAPPRAAG